MSTNPTTLKSSEDRFLAAIDIIFADLIIADADARNEAKRIDCLPELLTVREMLLEELHNIRHNVVNNG